MRLKLPELIGLWRSVIVDSSFSSLRDHPRERKTCYCDAMSSPKDFTEKLFRFDLAVPPTHPVGQIAAKGGKNGSIQIQQDQVDQVMAQAITRLTCYPVVSDALLLLEHHHVVDLTPLGIDALGRRGIRLAVLG